MTVDIEQLKKQAGFSSRQSSGTPKRNLFNQLAVDGNNGSFTKTYLLEDKVEVTDEFGEKKTKYRTTTLTGEQKFVILARRDLWTSRGDGGSIIAEVLEHSPTDEFVTYRDYAGRKTETIPNDWTTIKEMNPTLKLEHRVYVYDQAKDEVLSLVVKGGSTSHKDPKDKTGSTYVRPFTDYLKGDGAIPFIVETSLAGKPFKTSTGIKYYIEFSKTRDLSEDEVTKVSIKTMEVLAKLNNTAEQTQPAAQAVKPSQTKTEEQAILEDFGVKNNNQEDIEFTDSNDF